VLVALLLYGYSRGVYSSRQLARSCEERVDFIAVCGLNKPDFRTISDFHTGKENWVNSFFIPASSWLMSG